jgi:hypothetical protein
MARYNPMQSVRALSGLQLSGQGLAWEGKERGLGRQAIQKYLNEQARAATKAGSGIGLSNILGKGAGLLTMYLTGNIPAAAAVSGGISGLGGSIATSGLSRGGAPDVLYGVAEAEEAESYAHQAIDTLMGSVVPKALSTAITTPLEYMTLMNTFSPTTASTVSKFAKGDIGKLFSAGQEGYKQKGILDLLNLASQGTGSGGDIRSTPPNPYDYGALLKNPYMRLGIGK